MDIVTKSKAEKGRVLSLLEGLNITYIISTKTPLTVAIENPARITAANDLLNVCRFAKQCAAGPIEGMTVNEAAIKIREMLTDVIYRAESSG